MTHSQTDDDGSEQTTFEFSESEPSYLSCKAQGGNPKPTLKIFRGKLDITSSFKHSVKENKTGPVGLQVTHYTVELFNPEFTVPVSYRGDHMRCVAKIHKVHDLKRTKTASIDVKCKYNFSYLGLLNVKRFESCPKQKNIFGGLDRLLFEHSMVVLFLICIHYVKKCSL